MKQLRFCFSVVLFLAFAQNLFSQKISPANLKAITLFEDTLKEYSEYIQTDTLTEDRMVSDSIFIRTLVRALQVKNSFYFPFKNVLGISKLYAPDSSFRIITWNITLTENYNRQRGAIQMKTADGRLKLFPLTDCSEFTDGALDSIRTKDNWIGAVYYNILQNEYKGRQFYTLIGLDLNSVASDKKWVDVLSFNQQGEPRFGEALFSFEKEKKPAQRRYNIEFKKGARIMLNYDKDLKMIIVDHLVSENNNPDLKWTYVPDGDSEGFVWKQGKWEHVDKVFDFKLNDGEAPREVPILK